MTRELGGSGETDQYIDFAGTQGKYALLMVPDYDLDAADKQTSYTSLGASSIPDSSYSAWARFRGNTKGIRQHTDGQLVTTTRSNRLDVTGGNYELHVRGAADPGIYDDTTATAFRNADEAYQRLGVRNGSPHLPQFLDADNAKKEEIQRIVTTITSPDLDVNKFAWEDHAGGHRLTTTKGDKLEIVKGKSYIHVLGADDFDVSEGQKAISRSGSDPQATGYSASQNADKRPFIVDRTWARRQISETWLGVDRAEPRSNLPMDELIALDSFPAVIDGESREYTYAAKLSSYTGSEAHRVANTYDESWVTTAEERAYGTTMKSYTGSSAHWVDDVEDETHAHRINSKTTCDASNEVMMAKGAIAETTLVPFMTSTQISVLLAEFYVGAHLSIEAGAGIEIKGGAYMEIFMGTKLEIELGGGVKFSNGVKELTLENSEITAVKNDLALKASTVAAQTQTVAAQASITAPVVNLGTP